MKFMFGIGMCCLLTAGAQAQRGGGGHAGAAAGVRPGGRAGGRAGVARSYGATGYRGFRNSYHRPYWGSYWPWFYGYPGFWNSSYYDSDYSYNAPYETPYETQPNVSVVYPPPAPPAPVVINLVAHPVMHEYRQPEDYGLPSEHSARPVLYLIAFNDHVIRAATTYWVENGRLRYLDTDHKPKEAPLSSVDQDFSAQLNRERRVPFSLQ